MTNNIQQLKNIKKKLDNKELSVMVGAGFSMNVSSAFPTWWTLLYDIVKYLYTSEINDSYNLYKVSIKNEEESIQEEQYFDSKIGEILEREGYLEVVSKYIKRKGFRESITTYIEKKTPHIINKNDKAYLLTYKDDQKIEIELTNKMVFQHKLLLQLPWNNIYTTNYDTLLEENIDFSIENKLNCSIKNIEKNNIALSEKRESLIRNGISLEKEKISTKSDEKNVDLIPDYQKSSIANYTSDEKDTNNKSKGLDQGISEINIKIGKIDDNLRKNEAILSKLNKGLSDCFTLVTRSSDLSIKRNKNIIKLHGNLRPIRCDKFGFDGDIHRNYIIAKEDYETYPKKHEAFTQLMRISLLQESYVLIGFSGVDPNFTSWIGWVRDILERKENNGEDFKIYLIDVDSKPIDEDKALFFRNHSIVRIPIMDSDLVEYLEKELDIRIKNRKNEKEVFELFFNYFSRETSINIAKSIIEIQEQIEYQNIWDSIKISHSKKFNYKDELAKVPDLKELKKGLRIPSINFGYSRNKNSLIYFANKILQECPEDFQESLSDLIVIAVKDSLITTDCITDFNDIDGMIKGAYARDLLDSIKLRTSVLKNDKITYDNICNKKVCEDAKKYESILFEAFNFNFDELNVKIIEWEPNNSYVLKKAGLLALYDVNKAKDDLNEYVSNYENLSNQEQLYALQLLKYIDFTANVFSKNINKTDAKIKKYVESGIKKIDDSIEYLIEGLNDKKQTLKPYNEGRFSVSTSFSFSNDSSIQIKGIQFIQTFLEIGFPLCLNSVYFKRKEDWYMVFKLIFEFYPYPSLFFSLQYSDEKLLRRIAQDYSYSKHINNQELEDIIIKLLKAYQQTKTPYRIKKNILNFTSELFIAVDPAIWNNEFLNVWEKLKKAEGLFVENHFEEHKFIIQVLPYITDISILKILIEDILGGVERFSDITINYLFYLSKNKELERNTSNLISERASVIIDELISKIPDLKENVLFSLGNLYKTLSVDQMEQINKQLKSTNLQGIQSDRIWTVVLFFADNDNDIISKIKYAIINSARLWYSGIKGNTVSFGKYEFIKLRNLQKINWSKKEAIKIYSLLLSEFSKIQARKSKSSDVGFTSILEEMYFFLKNEKINLENEVGYSDKYQEIKELYYKARKYLTIYEGILSEDSSVVVWALNDFFNKIYLDKQIILPQEFTALLNKIYFQKGPSIEAAISYVSNCFVDFKDESKFKEYKMLLCLILKRYKDVELLEYDKPFLQLKLIKIAEVLEYWGCSDEDISYWVNVRNDSRYNNIKQDVSS